MVRATLEVLITTEGKDRGGPGLSVPLRISEQAWERLLEECTSMTPEELVRWAMIFAHPDDLPDE